MAKSAVFSRRRSSPRIEEVRALIRDLLSTQLENLQRTQKDLGVDAAGLQVMLHLASNGDCNPSAIAKRLNTSTAATSLLLQRLEDAGHVSRHADPSDGRKVLVTPSKESIQAAYRSGDHVVRGTIELIESLPESELKVVKKFLEKLVATYRA